MDSEDSVLFTIFVDNLPEDVGLIWFRNFFNQYGVVVDAYIPIKRSKVTKRRFGFVRYNCASSAEVAISKANGFWIEDRKLFVKWAAFDVRRNKPIQNKVDQVLSNGNGTTTRERKNLVGFGLSFADVVVGRNKSKPIRPSVRVSVDGNKWLDRSAVGWLASPRSMDSLRQGFIADGFPNIQLRDMGGNLVLLTFSTLEEMCSMLEESRLCLLKNWFDDVKKWSPDLKLEIKREVWLSCYGIPLHLWNADTFFNIGNTWGEAISIDDSTFSASSFSVGKVKILTNVFEIINHEISLVFNDYSFTVRVIEEQGVVINSLETKGKRNKKKCVVLRAAVASAALSASISSGDINNRNRMLLDEAQAIWEVDKLFGISYNGDESEVISKIAEMEALNKARANINL